MPKLHCYASGSGCLDFVWCDLKGKAINQEVTKEDVINYLSKYKYGEIYCINGHWCSLPPIRRLSENTVYYDGKTYTLQDGNIYSDHGLVRHISTLAALNFYLKHEKEILAQR